MPRHIALSKGKGVGVAYGRLLCLRPNVGDWQPSHAPSPTMSGEPTACASWCEVHPVLSDQFPAALLQLRVPATLQPAGIWAALRCH